MNAFLTIVKWTTRETLRDRILWAYGIFAVLLVLGLFAVAKVPWGETHIIVGQLGYTAIGLVSQVLAGLLAALQLGRDAERRVHYMILGRDISRRAYLLGRFTGLWFTTTAISILLIGLLFALNTAQANYRGPVWATFAGVPAIALQVAMVLAVATLIYQVTTSTTLAMVLAIIAVAIGRTVASAQKVLEEFGGISAVIGKAAAYLFPNLELLTFNRAIVYEVAPAAGQVAFAVVYAVAFSAVALTAAILIFDRKEL